MAFESLVMKNYIFFFYRPDHPVPSFDIAECANDDEARRRAPDLAQARPQCGKVEVWEDSRLVDQLLWEPRHSAPGPVAARR